MQDTTPSLKKSDQNLIWLDCEMTGLDPEGNPKKPSNAPDRILEIAVIVTDAQLTVRVEGPVFVIHQSDAMLAQMDKWNQSTHGKSGLIDKVRASTTTEEEAQTQLIKFLSAYVPKEKSPCCGNTVSQDRRFLNKYMPKLDAFFHYRNIDVSTLKELAARWAPSVKESFKKAQKHTALADVHESIDELMHYRAHFLKVYTPQDILTLDSPFSC